MNPRESRMAFYSFSFIFPDLTTQMLSYCSFGSFTKKTGPSSKKEKLTTFLLIFFLIAERILGNKFDLKQDSSELIGFVIFKNFSFSSNSLSVFSSVKDHVIISKIFLLTNNFLDF